MTIICAQFDDKTGKLVLGCNSRSRFGDTILVTDRSKWQIKGDWALSFTGLALLNDAVAAIGDEFPGGDLSVWQMMAYLREIFAGLAIGKEETGGLSYETAGLLAHRDGRLWHLDTRLSAVEVPKGEFWALGSGMRYGLGAAHALPRVTAKTRVKAAIAAAIAYDAGCPGTPVIEEFGHADT